MTKSTWFRWTFAMMLLGGATGAHAHEGMAGKPPEQLAETLAWASLTLATCPRAELTDPPVADPFKHPGIGRA